MDEHNVNFMLNYLDISKKFPMILPNGQVYSYNALKEMS